MQCETGIEPKIDGNTIVLIDPRLALPASLLNNPITIGFDSQPIFVSELCNDSSDALMPFPEFNPLLGPLAIMTYRTQIYDAAIHNAKIMLWFDYCRCKVRKTSKCWRLDGVDCANNSFSGPLRTVNNDPKLESGGGCGGVWLNSPDSGHSAGNGSIKSGTLTEVDDSYCASIPSPPPPIPIPPTPIPSPPPPVIAPQPPVIVVPVPPPGLPPISFPVPGVPGTHGVKGDKGDKGDKGEKGDSGDIMNIEDILSTINTLGENVESIRLKLQKNKEIDYPLFSLSISRANSALYNVNGLIHLVELDLIEFPSNIKKQPGYNAPDVLFIGWAQFGYFDHWYEKMLISNEKRIWIPEKISNKFSFTGYNHHFFSGNIKHYLE